MTPAHTSTRLLSLAVALVTAVALVAVAPATADASPSGAEARILNHHNSVRGSSLQRSSDLDAYARRWASNMASSGSLYHSNYRSLASSTVTIGENVAYFGLDGMDADAANDSVYMNDMADWIAANYMNSSSHRTNILNGTYTQVGVGIAVDAQGRVWNTVVFRGSTGSSGGSGDSGGSGGSGESGGSSGSDGAGGSGGSGGSGGGSTGPTAAQREAAAQAKAAAAERERVTAIQQPLADLGWYTSTVDGLPGPGTEQAVRDFQRAAGLAVTGDADAATLTALADDGALTRTAYDKAEAERRAVQQVRNDAAAVWIRFRIIDTQSYTVPAPGGYEFVI